MGENLSLGFRFQYEFRDSMCFYLLSPLRNWVSRLQFAVSSSAIWGKNLGKKSRRIRALIEVSNDPIWGKILVYKKVNMCKCYSLAKIAM